MVFNIPREVDEFLVLMFLLLFVLSFMINTNQCGIAVSKLIDENIDFKNIPRDNQTIYNLSNLEINKNNHLQNTYEYYILKVKESYVYSSNKGFYFGLILYWIILPILCFYYAFFVFKKGMWDKEKDLNIGNNNINVRDDIKKDGI